MSGQSFIVDQDDSHRDQFVAHFDDEAAIYIREVMLEQWQAHKDYGAKEIADGLTEALAR